MLDVSDAPYPILDKDGQDVKADRIFLQSVGHQIFLCGSRHTVHSIRRDGFFRTGAIVKIPRLDFYEDYFPIVCSDDVDFACCTMPVAFKDMVVTQQKVKDRAGFPFSAQVIVFCHNKAFFPNLV